MLFSSQVFRQGLLNGDKHIIHPILEWLLKNTKDLQKRAYLGKYLVKLEIPNEILTDVDIYNIYEQYESLVENFKAVHKESEAIENSGVNINELRNDLTAMENERDIVIKRLEQMSRKVSKKNTHIPYYDYYSKVWKDKPNLGNSYCGW